VLVPSIVTCVVTVCCPQLGLKFVPDRLVYASLSIDITSAAATVGAVSATVGTAAAKVNITE